MFSFFVNYAVPFHPKSLTMLYIFRFFRNKLVKGGKGWNSYVERYFQTRHKQRVRRPSYLQNTDRGNAKCSSPLSLRIYAVFKERNSSTDFVQYFFSCVMASLHKSSPGLAWLHHRALGAGRGGVGETGWKWDNRGKIDCRIKPSAGKVLTRQTVHSPTANPNTALANRKN